MACLRHWSLAKSTKAIAGLCLPFVLINECSAQADPSLPAPGSTFVSRDEQQQLGFQAASEVYKQMPVLPDSSPETQYIRQVGKRLVATIPTENSWPFEFHVVAQKAFGFRQSGPYRQV